MCVCVCVWRGEGGGRREGERQTIPKAALSPPEVNRFGLAVRH